MENEEKQETLARAVIAAKAVLAEAELKANGNFGSKDHDLLVIVHESVKSLRVDVQKLTENTGIQTGDHENRLRMLETFKSVLIGGFIISNVIIVPILIWLVIRSLSK